jgi:hypothetical protein
MATLFSIPKQYVPDQTGAPMMGAQYWFYEIGTSTPKDTFTDRTLTVANSNPVYADAYGIFPPIWLDDSGVDYRAKLVNALGETQHIVDGLVSGNSATDLLTRIKTVDGTGSGLDADLLDGIEAAAFAQLAQSQTVSGAWNFTTGATLFGLATGFRNIPIKRKTAQHTLELSDQGYCIAITTGGILIPTQASVTWPVDGGTAICVYNDSGSNQTIAAVTPATTTLRLAGSATTGSRTLAQRGNALLWNANADEWLIYGAGVS